MRKVLVFLGMALLCGNLWADPLPTGAKAPADLGRTLSGQEVSVPTLRGKVVVISFWATWCSYCMKELPVLASVQVEADKLHLPLQVVAVNYKEDRRTFRRAANMLRRSAPGLLMTWDAFGTLNKSFGLSGTLPTMIMLHRDGTVAHVHVGYDESMLDPLVTEINELMKEPAPPTTDPSPSAGVVTRAQSR